MGYINRAIQPKIEHALAIGKSILLLGPRQTGKTTMLKHITQDFLISFIDPRVRQRYEKDPSLLADELKTLAAQHTKKPLIIIDEVQKVPEIMDVVQYLIDDDIAQFILTGSSARKLKKNKQINLLPGRVIVFTLDALSIEELSKQSAKANILDFMLYGTLPGVINTQLKQDKEELLYSYVTTYLEEEIRSEAVVRNLSHFSRFLELAAAESGLTVNYSKLSQTIGVAHTTIAEYYQILEDCLVAFRVEPFLKSRTRNKLSKSNKYLLFDLGVRRLAANEGTKLPTVILGHLFEQFVGLELIKLGRLQPERPTLRYWKDLDGPEVDWVLQLENNLVPIEVKYTDSPKADDAKHLKVFLNEYEEAKMAYVVCQCPRSIKLADNIVALPWQQLNSIFTYQH
jgi:predicted AAA+ superfamily ATPase